MVRHRSLTVVLPYNSSVEYLVFLETCYRCPPQDAVTLLGDLNTHDSNNNVPWIGVNSLAKLNITDVMLLDLFAHKESPWGDYVTQLAL